MPKYLAPHHYNFISDVANKRFSVNAQNTQYVIGPDGTNPQIGIPDILYDELIVVRDASLMWTHGKAHHFITDAELKAAVTAATEQARVYTDAAVQALADTMGITAVLTLGEYLTLKQDGLTRPQFYAIYKGGELDRMYFDRTLFARRASEGEVVPTSAFPLTFPIVFS